MTGKTNELAARALCPDDYVYGHVAAENLWGFTSVGRTSSDPVLLLDPLVCKINPTRLQSTTLGAAGDQRALPEMSPGGAIYQSSSHRSVLQGQIPGTSVSVGLERGASFWMRHCAHVYCGPLLERGASLWMRHCARVYCGRLSVDL